MTRSGGPTRVAGQRFALITETASNRSGLPQKAKCAINFIL